ATSPATVQIKGYNTAKVSIQVTSNVVTGNTFKVTPSGHIYFLSNLSGNIDVVKTNLDGSGRTTVLAGTGKEDPNTTSLLATRDWRYLVLQAKRDTTHSALYLIDTATDKLTQFDTSDATFNLIGWYGHNFVYDLVSNTTPQSQNSHELVKSYDAENTQLNQLDQTQAEGTATSYGYQGFSNFYILDNAVVYSTHWYTYDSTPTTYDLSSKTDAIRAVQPGRQNKKDYQTFPATNVSYIQAALYEPQAVNFAAFTSDNKTSYYTFENQSIAAANLSENNFNKDYPTYLLSPDSSQTFWTELRDGKNTLFTGNNNAANKKQIASLSEYSPYGWYSNDYLLVSKAKSELYIMPVSGSSKPLKITDYYKPARTYNGYGYGYGGL
ncbi:MAG: hypothetical protein JWL89_265, partial [Candidatus Saccharibacteria bacterium]|nr:hypothetical protein [Candidatus Saccharibacteria bacterium]